MLENKEVAKTTLPARYDPFALLREMSAELESAFDRPFFGSAFNWPATRAFALPVAAAWTPRVDVFERDNHLVTHVDLPGVKKEEVKVEVTDGMLTISGERKTKSEEKKENIFKRECTYGNFHRTVPLPEGVGVDQVEATFADGVLEVVMPLPKPAENKVRQVPIGEPAKTAA